MYAKVLVSNRKRIVGKSDVGKDAVGQCKQSIYSKRDSFDIKNNKINSQIL